MPSHNVVSWNVIILGRAKCGLGQKGLELVEQMQSECVQPDPVTFVRILNACDSLQALEEDRCAHRQMIEIGCDCNVFIGNSLMDMYAKCGSIKDAWGVFNKMPSQDVVSWNCHDSGICEMWPRAEVIRTISPNATRCAT
jgi:pentatricopeptide repeat protein